MGATYSWHKGAVRIAPTWSVSTNIFQDELFSSWLIRCALLNGCDPITLTWNLWPDWRPWTIDIDRLSTPNKLFHLSRYSGISVADIQKTTLQNVARTILPTHHGPHGIWPWILAVGIRGASRRYALQYCPICLQKDNMPYYRIQWRMAWHTGCQKHKCLLLDRCLNCNSPLQPHRISANNKSITVCSHCGNDLRKAPHTKILPSLLAFQNLADNVVKSNEATYNQQTLAATEWLELVHFFSLLTRKVCLRTTKAYQELINLQELKHLKHTICPPKDRIELLSINERIQILTGAAFLMRLNSDSLKQLLKNSNSTRQGFCPQGTKLPSILQDIYSGLSDNSRSRKYCNKSKPFKYKPTPRSIVKRKMERLLQLIGTTPNE